jgi:hypothetical protein
MRVGWFSRTETVRGGQSVSVAGHGGPDTRAGAVRLRTAGDARAARVATVTSPAHPNSADGIVVRPSMKSGSARSASI